MESIESNYKYGRVKSTVTIITLNVNSLNTFIKRHDCQLELKFQLCDAYKKYSKYRDMGSESQDKKIQHTNTNQKNARVIILT